jgi:hypothetical protein
MLLLLKNHQVDEEINVMDRIHSLLFVVVLLLMMIEEVE